MNLKKTNLIHNSFEIGIFIKGIDGILEIIGAFLLMVFNPIRLNWAIVLLTQHELSEDPDDIIANYLLRISHGFSASTQHFGIFYLLIHGIMKLFLVTMLLKRKLWAYPFTAAFLSLFIAYQIYRYTVSHSIWLIILSIFDFIVITLTLMEYRRIKSQKSN